MKLENRRSKIEKIILVGLLFVLNILLFSLVSAHGNFDETKQLIDSNVSCDELNEEQLEEIGDYYMEQMHPGEAHEYMDEMMGGEDSETVKLMHINMAKSIYCGENSGMMGMMNMMMGGRGMMDGNMMGSGGMNSGMMSGYGNYGWNIYNSLYLILLIGLIVLVVVIIIKLLGNMKK